MPRLACRYLDDTHGDVRAFLDVVRDHRTVVHLVDVVAGQNEHVLGPMRENEIDILVDRIRRAAIPHGSQLLLRGNRLHEFAELAPQIAPAVLYVLDQRLRLVLREDGDLADAGIHAVGQHEVDDAELTAKGRGRFASVGREVLQALAASSGHDDGERAARQAAHVASGRSSRGLSGHVSLSLLWRATTLHGYNHFIRPSSRGCDSSGCHG